MLKNFSKIFFVFVIFASWFLFAKSASAATYYVDNTVTDTHINSATPDCTNYDPNTFSCGSGTSSVYATFADINVGTFQPDDQILFRRGETFREQLTVPSSGTSGHNIVFGAFGNGNNPILNGSALLSSSSFSPYTLASSTLYSTTLNYDLATGGTRNYRQVFTASGNSTTVRLRFTAATSANWVIAGVSIGPQSSTNVASSLTRVTFGGSNGITINAGTYADSDSIAFPTTSGTNYLVHVYMTQRNMRENSTSGTVWYDGNASDETLITTPTGSQLSSNTTSSIVTAVYGDGKTVWASTAMPTYPISSLTESGTTVTVTTPSAHELAYGQYVTIAGASPSGYNGTYAVSMTGPTTFTYTATSGLTPATGTVTYTMVSPIQVWEDNKFLAKQSSISAVSTPGSWYWDGTTLYVNGWNQDNPATNGRSYEVAHLAYGIFDNSKNYLEIKNINSIQTYGSSDSSGNYSSNFMGGIYLQGSNNIVHDLEVYNTWRHGFSFYTGSTNGLAYNLTVHDDLNTTPTTIYGIGTTGNVLENSTIYNSQSLCGNNALLVIHGTANGNVVQNNDFNVQVGNPTTVINTYDTGTNSNTIKFNHIHGGFQHAISGTAVSNDIIYGNVIDGKNGTSAVMLFNTGSGTSVYNNTIISPTGQYGLSLTGHSGAIVKNNIFYGPETISADIASQLAFISDYNLFYNSSGASWQWGSSAYNTFSDWKNNSSQDSHSLNIDPVFTNYLSNDYTLLSTSPVIDKGFDLGSNYANALSPSSIWPSSVSTVDQSTRGFGWEMGAYIFPVPQSPTIGTPTAQSPTSIRWNFTDNASDETGFRIYDNTNTLATSSATANLSYLDETGLSENTQYSGRYATAYNSYGNSASSSAASAIYTLADTPTNLSASSNSNSITLSIDSFPNDTSGQSGYYFSRSGANSGWIQTNSWTDSGLSCGHEYTYSVKYRNGDGTNTSEISTTKSTSGCGGGGSPAMWALPIVPNAGYKLNINNGSLTTSNRNVILGFNAGTDIKKMAISMTGDFTDASQQDYTPIKQWDLCSKLGEAIKNPTCPDGTYKVYVQFYTAYGRSSNTAIASSSIVLNSTETSVSTQKYIFPRNLSLNMSGQDVKNLQKLLNSLGFIISKNGAGSPGKETTLFGSLTYKALQKFQKSVGLPSTGYFGPMTRDYLKKN